jgi:MFS superfamily sulfate permease-like transporter
MGMLHVGRLTNVIMPETMISGFTTGAAFYIATSQIPNLLGVAIPRSSGPGALLYSWWYVVCHLHQIHLPTICFGAGAIAFMRLLARIERRRIHRLTLARSSHLGEHTPLLESNAISRAASTRPHLPIPEVLLAIGLATALTQVLHLDEHYKIAVVGQVPTGLPSFAIPDGLNDWSQIQPLLWPAFMIACIGFVLTISIAKTFALKFNYSIDEDRELIAIGLSSMCGAFFSCYLSCGSLTRSAVLVNVGAKSKLASMVSVFVVLLTLGWFTGLLHSLPLSVLAAVIILACRSLLAQMKIVPQLWHEDRPACYIWVTTFLAVLLLDVQLGAAVGIAAVLSRRMLDAVTVTH